jgi:pSer/pThr/pTyr-binding forkhead associated (FHA) protein
MQIVLVIGRFIFLGLIYLLLFRLLTALLADLRGRGIMVRPGQEFGRLEVLTGADFLPKGRVLRIDSKGLRIGRGKNNDIVLPDHFASIEHALFRQQKGVTMLEDLGSTNGTWVNGERIHSPVQLVAGDYIKIGSVTFQYSRWEDESSKFQ